MRYKRTNQLDIQLGAFTGRGQPEHTLRDESEAADVYKRRVYDQVTQRLWHADMKNGMVQHKCMNTATDYNLSLLYLSEPTRKRRLQLAKFCLITNTKETTSSQHAPQVLYLNAHNDITVHRLLVLSIHVVFVP
mgnify:CR=1 FL=1